MESDLIPSPSGKTGRTILPRVRPVGGKLKNSG
jgi:hypothetical protein